MITADTLKTLTKLNARDLALTLDVSGYTGCSFKTAQFLGITNGGQFCYKVTYHDDMGTGQDAVGKVFVTYNAEVDGMTADF